MKRLCERKQERWSGPRTARVGAWLNQLKPSSSLICALANERLGEKSKPSNLGSSADFAVLMRRAVSRSRRKSASASMMNVDGVVLNSLRQARTSQPTLRGYVARSDPFLR